VREVDVEFAVRDGAYIAYVIFGSGPVDLVLLANTSFPIDLMWDLPPLAEFLDALGEMARVITFDARGQGASDPLPTTDGAAGTENAASDLLAVLDAAGSERPSIMTFFTAGTSEMVFAATYPQRVRSLILSNLRSSYPEMRGMSTEQRKTMAAWLSTPRGLKFFNPRLAHDPMLRRWWGRSHRLVGSPEQWAGQMEFAASIDTSSILEQVRTPALVFHRQGSQMWDIETSRATAARLPNARFVELPGSETHLFLGDTAPVLGEIRRFLREPDVAAAEVDNRQLATVLFTDIASSTEHLASLGDQAWRVVLDNHDSTVDRLVSSYRGTVIKRLGDGMLATFDGPARAVRCATTIREALAASGIHLRAGLHTGEIELRDGDVAGLAVHIAGRVADVAAPGEILVSRTVVDLTGGSGITYDPRGDHKLKGIPGKWPIFAAQVPAIVDS
jgi:class 3 adenylate cyclase/pimeloyl-ACP methyl ester carboxylesterase